MTPRQIEREFEKLNNALTRNVTRAVVETQREGVRIAKQDSSGRWNRKRRQRAGYSYSRFNPNPPPQPLEVINVEKGIFRAAWTVEPVRSSRGGDVVGFVVNRSDRVQDLVDAMGKPWLSRAIDERVALRIEPVFQFNVEKAVIRSF